MKYPLWQYPHGWWWKFRQLVHDRHVWRVECYLYRDQQGRSWLQGSEPPDYVAVGAIERCVCGKGREVWPASADRSPEGGDTPCPGCGGIGIFHKHPCPDFKAGLHAEHESAVAKPDARKGSHD